MKTLAFGTSLNQLKHPTLKRQNLYQCQEVGELKNIVLFPCWLLILTENCGIIK